MPGYVARRSVHKQHHTCVHHNICAVFFRRLFQIGKPKRRRQVGFGALSTAAHTPAQQPRAAFGVREPFLGVTDPHLQVADGQRQLVWWRVADLGLGQARLAVADLQAAPNGRGVGRPAKAL